MTCQLLICDISINFCDSFFFFLHCTISTCIYFCLQSCMFWMNVISYWCYIFYVIFCVSLQIIKIFLMRKISIITIFFTLSLSARPREIISLKKKLVLSYRIFYKFTVIFVTCWNLQIIKTTFIFFFTMWETLHTCMYM